MSNRGRKERYEGKCGTRLGIAVLALLVVLITGLTTVSRGHAEGTGVVAGTIQGVVDEGIRVNDGFFNIVNVPISNTSGESLLLEDLRSGDPVKIYFRDGKMSSVLIIDQRMAE